ncbi:MAG: amino acid-binding domain protein [Frankiales bacterium]|nr:amino acid-binding domain protein [Frankiales bacterium]
MLFELRMSVDDRPGSLARLTRLLADRAIDVRAVDILGSIVGKAVDVLLIDCSAEQAAVIAPELRALAGFELLSLHPAHHDRSDQPELDLLTTLAQPGGDTIAAFTQAAVPAFSADWAMAFPVGRGPRAEFSTALAPEILWNGWTPKRATRVLPGVYTGAAAPFEGIHAPLGVRHVLLLGRSPGPAFHELEVMRVNRLMGVAGSFIGLASTASLFAAGGGARL